MSFEKFQLHAGMLDAIKNLGFEKPTAIQEQTIPLLLKEEADILALAQTGTGKTAAFGLPLLQKITALSSVQSPFALILTPTRELCLQIHNELRNYSAHLNQVRIEVLYGGSSLERQISALKNNPHIICATPGRLIDLMDRKALSLSSLRVLILDEADEMLNMGFREDIEKIIHNSSSEKNIWMFSATMPREVKHLVKKYLRNPVTVQAGVVNVAASAIEHHAYVVHSRDKFPTLKRILDYYPDIYGIVFCRTKTDTQKLSDELVHEGYSADALHGDLTQSQREWVMKRFRKKTVRILVATDVAARGIDVDNLTHVIHYHLPDNPEVYTHRSGRTARAGKSGISVSIYSSRDAGKYREIQQVCKFKGIVKSVPSVEEILRKQTEFYLRKLLDAPQSNQENYLLLLSEDIRKSLENVSKEQLVNFYLENILEKLKKSYSGNSAEIKTDRENSHGGSKKSVFRLNLGKFDGLDFSDLRKNLSSWTRISEKEFYIRELKNSYSLIEVSSAFSDVLLTVNKNTFSVNGRIVRIEKKNFLNKEYNGINKTRSKVSSSSNKKKPLKTY